MTRDELLNKLTDYERGYIDGLWAFAWWKDGEAFVGTTGSTYQDAVRGFLVSRGYAHDDVVAVSW